MPHDEATPQSPKRARGRPRAAQVLEPVMTRLPLQTYDRLIKFANRRETSVADALRQIVVFTLRDRPR